MDHISDEKVVALVQKGGINQFGLLVERYEQKLLRYGRKFLSNQDDIADIVQEVFMRSYQNIQSFDVEQQFSSWIYRIAHNAFVNGMKKKSRNPLLFVDFDTFFAHPVYENPILHEEEQTEIKKMIDKSLEILKPKYREVLVLYYIENFSYKDISDILEVPIGTIGIRLKRAKEMLKVAYEELTKKQNGK